MRPEAILSHESAAVALGLPVFGEPRLLHTFHPDHPGTVTEGDVRKHASQDPREIVITDLGLSTAACDTAWDLGRTQHAAFSLAVWDQVLACGGTIQDLRQWRDQKSRRNTQTLEWLETHADGAAESPGESLLRALVICLGFPAPELQVAFAVEGLEYRADLYWREIRTIGEFDGYAKYSADGADPRLSLKNEKRREDSLRRAGFRVVRWEYRDLFDLRGLERRLTQSGLPRIHPQHVPFLTSFERTTARGHVHFA